MEWYYIVPTAVITVIAVLIFVSIFPAVAINAFVFKTRQDKEPLYKYFTPQEFGLNVEPIAVTYRGVNLDANIYTVKPVEACEKVVIFQHGFGAGTSSYMTEIAHFAEQGFAVVAVDAYGCNNSAGENIIGFYAGADAVIAAFIGVNCDERLKNKPKILVGHSWGAYSVLAASSSIKVDGVVALSGFNAPAQCLRDMVKNIQYGRFYAPLTHGWFWLFNFFKFGAKGNLKAAKAVKKSGVKTLIIHGEKDDGIGFKNSAANKVKGDNVTVILLPDKYHNPYNTVAAEEKLRVGLGKDDFENEEEEKEYFANFDWAAVTEEDEEVMRTIEEFIENV